LYIIITYLNEFIKKKVETNFYLYKTDIKNSVVYGNLFSLTNTNNGTLISKKPMEPMVRAFSLYNISSGFSFFTDFYANLDIYTMIKDEQYMDKSLNEMLLFGINMFYCHFGNCSTTQGFIKYLDEFTNRITVALCDSMCTVITDGYEYCQSQYTAYYDNELEKFFYCSKPIHKDEILPIDLTTNNKPLSYLVEYGNAEDGTDPIFLLLLTDNNGNCVGYSNSSIIS